MYRILCILLCFPFALRAEDPVSPEKEKAKQLASITPLFVKYVVSEDTPPQFSVTRGFGVKSCVFYNSAFEVVKSFKEPGIYGAVMEVNSLDQRPSLRYVTLYRVKEALPEADTEILQHARKFDIDPKQLDRHEKSLAEVMKRRPFSQWSCDPKAAQLLAGIRLGKGTGEVHKYDDGFAEERQWWVTLKRKLNGCDKEFPKQLESPRIVKGFEYPVVHEGTLVQAGMKPETAEKIDTVLREWEKDTDQAFAVCVVRKGVIVIHKAYGTRDGKPMTVDTKSWMASVTKAMSASLMYQLIDARLVSLDDDVSKFFPNLRGIEVKKPLKIRHLYTHTSGLAKWPGWNDELHDVEHRLSDYYPLLEVGETWAYGGTGNILGGKIIEAVSGECIPKFYQKHLLEPLGCKNTDVTGTHADTFSTPLDMAKFGQMLLQKGGYGGYRFFSDETFEKMLPRKLTTELGPDTMKTFGIGLDGQPNKFGHGAGSAATFSVDVENELVVVMTRNKQGTNYDKYNGKFWDAIKAGIVK